MKLRHLLGLPVLETETGMQIGEIGEALVNIETAAVCGFVIHGKDCCTAEGIIAFEDLSSLGHDAIMVHNHYAMRQIDTLPASDNEYYLRDIVDKQIFTDSGLCLGIVADIVFDSTSGEIKSYQVSDSIIADFLYGRLIMPLPQTQIIGHDKVIVPEATSKFLHTETEMAETQ
ncbi:MAG: PRC-barrel domain-containing protein [Sporomusaceae bacterium]|nr:PRC-barrel domain-containing protein [Sporomusaceae bacterium]